ncbi:hypothetical protein IW261DRAFT_1505572 [Armillaria novae-zelandiae]|uniref:Uncharacterized protein n=1 Tax=Armillaria novae-zelandiae TaxID=153914 RepID=A0AA39NWA8_9AGAR|nr:hypothetical protein IW261DRAFT_1505572 [Armillaria novae-zelandiae]
MVPHIDEYVIVQLDPVASLKGLEDPEVTEACKALVSKKYVACITWMQPVILGMEHISVSLTFVSNGIGMARPAEHLLPEMTIPIYPNTQHPLSRPPLIPSKEIPWLHCHQTTQLGCQVRWRNTREAGIPVPPAKHELTAKDATRLQMLSSEDSEWRSRLSQEDSAGEGIPSNNARHELQAHVAEDIGVPPKKSLTSTLLGLFPCIPDSASLYSNDNCSVCSDDTTGIYIFGEPPSDTMPIAILSNDLTSLAAEEIGDPWEFNSEMEALKRIEGEHCSRTRVAIEKTRALDVAFDEKLAAARQDSKPTSTKSKFSRICRQWLRFRFWSPFVSS